MQWGVAGGFVTVAIRCAALAQLWPSPVLGTAQPQAALMSAEAETGNCKHSGTVSPLFCLPFWTPITVSQDFFMVLCGCSFNLTSAYLWAKLLMAFSALGSGRWWQSKWAQDLGASSSKHCLHLEPDTKSHCHGDLPLCFNAFWIRKAW